MAGVVGAGPQLTSAAGVVFALGVRQWRGLPEEERRSSREVVVIAGVVVLVAILVGVAAVAVDDHPGAWRGPALVGTALVGATPMVCVAYAVWLTTRGDRDGMAAGEPAEWLLARRRALRTLLAGLGALVALSTLALETMSGFSERASSTRSLLMRLPIRSSIGCLRGCGSHPAVRHRDHTGNSAGLSVAGGGGVAGLSRAHCAMRISK
uniref:hypothetical protein n=1 Tax=Streptomyces fulvoviolaceus TaxID=285535 RepID=UPI0018FEA70D